MGMFKQSNCTCTSMRVIKNNFRKKRDKALVVSKGTCVIDSSISRHPWFRGEEGGPTKGQQSLGNSCHKLLSLRTLGFRKDSHWIMTDDITVSDQKGMFPLGEVSGVRGREKERV